MHSHHLGAMLMALQACGGVAAASTLMGRDDPKAGGGDLKVPIKDPDGLKPVSKMAKTDDGGDATTVVAYANGVCQTKLLKEPPGGGDSIKDTFEIKDTWPKATRFPRQNWNPAEKQSKDDNSVPQGGWNVYFSMKDPAPKCRTIVMVDFPGGMRGPAGGAPGVQIINAGKGGCYFASLADGQDILMSKCCGSECDVNATLQDQPTLQPDFAGGDNPKRAVLPAPHAPREPAAAGPMVARAGALAARLDKPDDPTSHSKFLYSAPEAKAGCNFTEKGKPFPQAGNQTVIKLFQNCQAVPCQFSAADAEQYSQTIKMDHTDTITQQLSITRGVTVDFKPEGIGFGTSLDIGYSISKAVADSYGKDTTKGNTTTFTATQSVVGGLWVALTYTPTYTCYTGDFDCGQPEPNPGVNCIPDDAGGVVAANSGNMMPLVRSA